MQKIFEKLKKIPIEKWFLILAVPLGILFMLAIPVGDGPDESSHFLRVNETGKGNLVIPWDKEKDAAVVYMDQGTMEAAVETDHSYADVASRLGYRATDDKSMYYEISNISIYSFVCYLPQAVGTAIGNLLNLPVLIIAYLGRLTNFIFWIILVYLAIKYLPAFKKVALVVSLLPITLQQATSLSPDACTFAVALALFAFVIYHIDNKAVFQKKDWILMILLTLFMGSIKYVYLPICLLLFLIPAERFGGKKQKYIGIGVLATVVILINVVWFMITAGNFKEPEGVNSAEQLGVLLKNPLGYIWVLVNTVRHNGEFVINSMFGRHLERFNVDVGFVPILLVIIMFSIIVWQYRKVKVSRELKYWPVFITVSVVLMSATVMFLKWSPVGQSYIDGLQGRYFLPVLFMAPLLFMKTEKKLSSEKGLVAVKKLEKENKFTLMVPGVMLMVNTVALTTTVIYHIML